MFTVHNRTDTAITFHYDAPNETPRRWHSIFTSERQRWFFMTDLCYSKPRKPGIPEELRGKTFDTAEDVIAAVQALNT